MEVASASTGPVYRSVWIFGLGTFGRQNLADSQFGLAQSLVVGDSHLLVINVGGGMAGALAIASPAPQMGKNPSPIRAGEGKQRGSRCRTTYRSNARLSHQQVAGLLIAKLASMAIIRHRL